MKNGLNKYGLIMLIICAAFQLRAQTSVKDYTFIDKWVRLYPLGAKKPVTQQRN